MFEKPTVTKWVAQFLIGSICLAAPAVGEELKPQERKSDLTIEVAPYVWAPNISGPVSFGPLEADLQLEPQELFADVNAGFMAAGLVKSGNNFVVFDTLWLDYSDDAFEPFFNQAVDVDLKYVQAGIGHSFSLHNAPGNLTIEPYLGIQHISISPEVSGVLGNISVDEHWTSPAVGIMLNADIHGRVSASVKVDYAGGFEEGDLMSVFSVVNCAFTDDVAIAIGYRWTESNLSADSGFGLDLDGGGPAIGLRWKLKS